jgi:hypothetical protein
MWCLSARRRIKFFWKRRIRGSDAGIGAFFLGFLLDWRIAGRVYECAGVGKGPGRVFYPEKMAGD